MQCDYLLAVDWLAYSAYGIVGEMSVFSKYKVVPKQHGTQVFKNLASIVSLDSLEEVAQIQYNPRSSALKPNLVIVKIANRLLYECDFVELIKEINSGLNLQYNALSRVDVCADFYTFKTIHPQQLIKNFLLHKARRFGKSKYVLHGNQDKKAEYEYLRFGSDTSQVLVYLYNKSVEMQEVKHKPYIVRRWSMLKYGFEDIATPPDVWRLEFRINNSTLSCVSIETGEELSFDYWDLTNSAKITALYSMLVQNYFRWAKPTAQKFIDCPEIKLFDFSEMMYDVTKNQRKDERAEVRKTMKFLLDLDFFLDEIQLEEVEKRKLLAQYHSQLPKASKELTQSDKKKNVVSFIKHFLQSIEVLDIDPIAYKKMYVRLKCTYPTAFERAQMWVERYGFRNEGDSF